MCLCLKYLVCHSKWRVKLDVWEVVLFPVSEEIVYSFFNLFFDIFWNSINLAYVSQLGEEDLVYDYIFCLSSRVSICSRYQFFTIPSLFLSHMELSRIKLPKLTSNILMEIVSIPVVLIDQFYFFMQLPIKAWLFEKNIFELDYH